MIRIVVAALVISLSTAALAQQAAPTGAPAVPPKPLDFISGMLFLCSPLYGADKWTVDVCQTLTEEAVAKAKKDKVPFGVLEPSPDPDQPAKVAKASGFDPTYALTVNLRFTNLDRVEKGWGLALRGRGRAKPLPGDNGVPRTSLFSQSAIFDATAKPADTLKVGRELLQSLFSFYTTPLKAR